jgi:hypothetical protein
VAARVRDRLTVVITSTLSRQTRPTIDEFDWAGTWIAKVARRFTEDRTHAVREFLTCR